MMMIWAFLVYLWGAGVTYMLLSIPFWILLAVVTIASEGVLGPVASIAIGIPLECLIPLASVTWPYWYPTVKPRLQSLWHKLTNR